MNYSAFSLYSELPFYMHFFFVNMNVSQTGSCISQVLIVILSKLFSLLLLFCFLIKQEKSLFRERYCAEFKKFDLDASNSEAAVQQWTQIQNAALYNLHFSKYVYDGYMKTARVKQVEYMYEMKTF